MAREEKRQEHLATPPGYATMACIERMHRKHGKPRTAAVGNRNGQPARARPGRLGGGEARSSIEAG